jgi:hypothetical protein
MKENVVKKFVLTIPEAARAWHNWARVLATNLQTSNSPSEMGTEGDYPRHRAGDVHQQPARHFGRRGSGAG